MCLDFVYFPFFHSWSLVFARIVEMPSPIHEEGTKNNRKVSISFFSLLIKYRSLKLKSNYFSICYSKWNISYDATLGKLLISLIFQQADQSLALDNFLRDNTLCNSYEKRQNSFFILMKTDFCTSILFSFLFPWWWHFFPWQDIHHEYMPKGINWIMWNSFLC